MLASLTAPCCGKRWDNIFPMRMCYQHVKPPSITRLLPLKKLLASEARNTTAGAISSGSPIRFIGEKVIQTSYQSLLTPPFGVIGVLI